MTLYESVKITHMVCLVNELLLLVKIVPFEEQLKTKKRRIWLKDDIVILLEYIDSKWIMVEKE